MGQGDDDGKRGRAPGTVPPPRAPSAHPPASLRTPSPVSLRTPAATLRLSAMRLSEIDFDLVNAGRRILDGALGIVPGERVVIVVDRERKDLATALVEVTHTIGATAEVVDLADLGARPLRRLPEKLEAILRAAQASVFLAGIDDGEQSMRWELQQFVRANSLRHAHMIGATRRSLIAGFSVDPSRILDATRAVRTRLRPDSTLRLRSTAGSDLEVKLDPRHRWAEHVGVIRPGRSEFLPSGKLVTTPADVNGVFVVNASIGGQAGAAAGLLERIPVRVEIEAGVCKSVRCVDRALQRGLEEFLRREHNLDRVGLVILGTNVGILRSVGEAVCDENIPGLHLAFGCPFPDQTGASWSTRTQLTMTGAAADVDLDGAALLRSGRYMVT
jgi:leucyl aminopeptidase (aminopeptidase T)